MVAIERVQTGVRIEKRLLKIMKAVAEMRDMTLGDLIEGVMLHAFDGKQPFTAETLVKVKELKRIYGLELDSAAAHQLRENKSPERKERKP